VNAESESTLILTAKDVAALLPLDECIGAVETAFRLLGEGKADPPGSLAVHAVDGGFHVKAGVLELQRRYFAAKVNANFPHNRIRFDLPTIRGIIVLCDAYNGRRLAVMDSVVVTTIRTGAATAVAAKYLAKKDAGVATIYGCGNQGRIQLKALAQVRRLRQVYAVDLDREHALAFAHDMQQELGIPISVVDGNYPAVTRLSDICVTCTTSRTPILQHKDIAPGTFIAAVGADNPEKQELGPSLFAGAKIVVDLLEQCGAMGDLHHAIDAGKITQTDVHAELGEVVAGVKLGRESDEEIIIFDSTGLAIQDVAAAAIVYEKAISKECLRLDFSGQNIASLTNAASTREVAL